MTVDKITGAITVAELVQGLGYNPNEQIDVAKYDEMISNANVQLQLHTRQAGQLMYIIGQMMYQVEMSGKLGTEMTLNKRTGATYNKQIKAVDYYSKKYGWGKAYISGLMRIANNFSAEQADAWGASKLMQISSATRMKQLKMAGITPENTLDEIKGAIKTLNKEQKEAKNKEQEAKYTPEQKEAIEKKNKMLEAGKNLLATVREINKKIAKGDTLADDTLDNLQAAVDMLADILD